MYVGQLLNEIFPNDLTNMIRVYMDPIDYTDSDLHLTYCQFRHQVFHNNPTINYNYNFVNNLSRYELNRYHKLIDIHRYIVKISVEKCDSCKERCIVKDKYISSFYRDKPRCKICKKIKDLFHD